MFGFSRHTEETLYGALIDIDSGSVGVAIVASNVNHSYPNILFKHRVYMRVTKRSQSDVEGMRRIREALFSASLILTKDGLAMLRDQNPRARIKHIFLTCTAPWSHLVTRNMHYKEDVEFKITDALMHDLLKSAESEIDLDIAPNDKTGRSGFTIVERATVDIRVNDYQIKQPIGLRGTEISLSHIVGLIPREVLEAVYEVRDKLFPKTEIHAHTSMLVSFSFLRDFFQRLNSFAIINILGEATEIGIAENSMLLSSTHIPYGSNSLIRSIMSKTGKTAGDVQSLLLAYAEGTLSQTAHDEVQTHFSQYQALFSSLLKNSIPLSQLPKTIVVTAHYPLEHFYMSLINGFISAEYGNQFKCIIIDQELIKGVSQDGIVDIYLTISSAFFHKLHRHGEIVSH